MQTNTGLFSLNTDAAEGPERSADVAAGDQVQELSETDLESVHGGVGRTSSTLGGSDQVIILAPKTTSSPSR